MQYSLLLVQNKDSLQKQTRYYKNQEQQCSVLHALDLPDFTEIEGEQYSFNISITTCYWAREPLFLILHFITSNHESPLVTVCYACQALHSHVASTDCMQFTITEADLLLYMFSNFWNNGSLISDRTRQKQPWNFQLVIFDFANWNDYTAFTVLSCAV